MSDSAHIHSSKASTVFDVSSDPFMNESPFLPLSVDEIVSTIPEGSASSDQLNPFDPGEDILIGRGDMFSGMSQDLLLDTQMAVVNDNPLNMTHHGSQSSGIRSPPSSANTRGLLGTDNFCSDATDRLALTIERLSAKISDFEALFQSLESKVDEFSSRLDRAESQLDNLNNKMDSLELKFKTLDGLLLEVIRREHMAMQELGALASRYHGKD